MCDTNAALRHSVLVYESDEEYVARTLPFITEGLEAGEGCIVAHSRDRLAMMRDVLGRDSERVTFVDLAATYTRPAHALAIYHRMFVEHLSEAPRVRGVADFQLGPTVEDWDAWVGYEAMTNLAYAHLPVWVVCTYNRTLLPERVLDGVLRTHSEVLEDEWVESDRYEDPRVLLRRISPDPAPLAGLVSSSPGDDVEVFRERLARDLLDAEVPESSALEMLVAGTEVAKNAIEHGGGIAEVRTGRAEGRFVCDVVDRGSGFDDPMLGYLVPREGTGSGLWIARQLAWRLEAFHSPRGFTVRLWL